MLVCDRYRRQHYLFEKAYVFPSDTVACEPNERVHYGHFVPQCIVESYSTDALKRICCESSITRESRVVTLLFPVEVILQVSSSCYDNDLCLRRPGRASTSCSGAFAVWSFPPRSYSSSSSPWRCIQPRILYSCCPLLLLLRNCSCICRALAEGCSAPSDVGFR